jgi:glycosyltransferase involved in cell wall biosynthesis
LNILLISFHYPPDRAVGGQRARKVADSLRAAGHDVRVIVAGDAPDDDRVRRVVPLPSARDVYAALRRTFWGSEDNGDPDASGGDGAAASATKPTPFWKRWIFSLIWLPDDRQGFIAPAIGRALRLAGWRPDLIYTTAPPFSVHLAGLVLKVLIGAPWVAEFRDPWTANPWKPAYMRSAFSDWFERKLEWLCIESANLLVAVSEGIADRLEEAGTTTCTSVIRNGIEDLRSAEAVTAALRSSGPFEIVYAGSFYHARDPFPFLDAVQQVVADRSLGPGDLQIRFLGSTGAYEGRSLSDYLREADLDEYVRLESWVDPAESLARIQAADALLLLALDQPDQVPNKLYEYLGVRRPILAIADEDGESARMLKRVGGHHIVPANGAARIRRVLEDLLDEGRSGPVGDPTVLAEWTTTAQLAGLPRALEALAEGRADSWSYRLP